MYLKWSDVLAELIKQVCVHSAELHHFTVFRQAKLCCTIEHELNHCYSRFGHLICAKLPS